MKGLWTWGVAWAGNEVLFRIHFMVRNDRAVKIVRQLTYKFCLHCGRGI